ncbi:hypothetical protein E3J74_00685 [Candidatus Bathyarchaeota archaeon]|nr:MAG: hypothetical protein E3J74_00685 [Candidatus Bathyarchaeota archaeon]
MKGETRIKKVIVIMGTILLIAGIALAAYSTVETRTEENVVETWNIWPPTLNPPSESLNRTFWGRYMYGDMWFEFDVSSSHPLRLTVSILEYSPTPWMTTIFNEVGTSFTGNVTTVGGGTYQIDIINEGPNAVDLWGNVKVMQEETKDHQLYPYATPGTITALIGAAVLFAGIYIKPKPSKGK